MNNWAKALAATCASLLATQANAAILTATITGVVGTTTTYNTSPPTGVYAGVTGPFSVSLKYDTEIFKRTINSGFNSNADVNSYNAFIGGELTLDGKVLSGRNFYQSLSYSSPSKTLKNGYAAINLSYNFWPQDGLSSYIMNFSLVGLPANFLSGEESILFSDTPSETSFISQGFSAPRGSLIQLAGQTAFGTTEGTLSFIPETLSISAIPEPATWAMLLVGFAMVSAVVRRERKVRVSLV